MIDYNFVELGYNLVKFVNSYNNGFYDENINIYLNRVFCNFSDFSLEKPRELKKFYF